MRRRVLLVVVCVLAVPVATLIAQGLAAGSGPKPGDAAARQSQAQPQVGDVDPVTVDKEQAAKEQAAAAPHPRLVRAAEGQLRVIDTQNDPRRIGPPLMAGLGSGPQAETQQITNLVDKWKQAGNKSDRDNVQEKLHTALKEQFQARLNVHEQEIEQLEAEVKRLREQLELRRKKQNEIVEFRLQQLLREAQGLGWGTEPVRRTSAGAPVAEKPAPSNSFQPSTSSKYPTQNRYSAEKPKF